MSSKEALILKLIIGKGEMYGLELVAESNGELKRGTVYVTLGRMADKGYVESRTIPQDDGSGMPKRLFRATAYGARLFGALEFASAFVAGDHSAGEETAARVLTFPPRLLTGGA
ncbi:MAG TPA: helix-turn-helix transcriptional regulator [Thermoanaerobaculia bacterium]|nr:helix-turn-helix transcriptional regulator [Thermoanaerobaculia bacterium]